MLVSASPPTIQGTPSHCGDKRRNRSDRRNSSNSDTQQLEVSSHSWESVVGIDHANREDGRLDSSPSRSDDDEDSLVVVSPSSRNTVSSNETAHTPSSVGQTYHMNLEREPLKSIKAWLLDNFDEIADSNLSREALYADYVDYGVVDGMVVVNSASFGKLIRCVFPSIRNRRLGIRGQSKYHYNGIAIKPSSMLMHINSACLASVNEILKAQTWRNGRPLRKLSKQGSIVSFTESASSSFPGGMSSLALASQQSSLSNCSLVIADPTGSVPTRLPPIGRNDDNSYDIMIQLTSTPPMPAVLEQGLSGSAVDEFRKKLQEHYSQKCIALNTNDLREMEHLIVSFWRSLPNEHLAMLSSPTITKLAVDFDIYLFSTILNYVVTHSEVLDKKSAIYSSFKRITELYEVWMTEAVENTPEYFKMSKLQTTRAFVMSLKRCLNNFEGEDNVRKVLSTVKTKQQMLSVWRKLDMEFITQSVCSSCQWLPDFVDSLKNEMTVLIRADSALVSWKAWIENLVEKNLALPRTLTDQHDLMTMDFLCRQFSLKFNYFLSQIIRDISVSRNGIASLEPWHSLRFFAEEYLWQTINLRLTSLKLQNIAKFGQQYPAWMNSVLFFQLEQRNFFGAPIASYQPYHYPQYAGNQQIHPLQVAASQSTYFSHGSGSATPSLYALSRISSSQDILQHVLSRGNSFDLLDRRLACYNQPSQLFRIDNAHHQPQLPLQLHSLTDNSLQDAAPATTFSST